jgi:hypothetical protein
MNFCLRKGCKQFGSAEKYGRSCFHAGPQCLPGQLALFFDILKLKTMPGGREAIPIPQDTGSRPVPRLPLTAVEHVDRSPSNLNAPPMLHGVLYSSDILQQTNAGALPLAPAQRSSALVCDAGAFDTVRNCASCEETCQARPRGRC